MSIQNSIHGPATKSVHNSRHVKVRVDEMVADRFISAWPSGLRSSLFLQALGEFVSLIEGHPELLDDYIDEQLALIKMPPEQGEPT